MPLTPRRRHPVTASALPANSRCPSTSHRDRSSEYVCHGPSRSAFPVHWYTAAHLQRPPLRPESPLATSATTPSSSWHGPHKSPPRPKPPIDLFAESWSSHS